ncbi:NADPH:quinone reductase [Amycolatopsis arida]|uniref:NADPH:quinone reductase n=2 Tax=Amycolatopsis arida TaxID=587909 RepID=A0A1I5V830_9PSEU|nr:NADPH:quinone reductase-like Zn-dependent oxidoreductase [Amycolatopsis arida]SFQ03561.1 NADPH:quinone reductase [Amycolatopsis arida]
MTAAYVTGFGTAADIRVGSLPVPEPGPADVLVRVRAAAVNHVDTFVRSGAYRTALTFPFVLGRDLVGTVARPGSAVAGFPPGTPVWCNSLGHDGRQGSFSEYAVVPADRLYPLPAGVDPVAAVAVLHTAATAHIGLFREAGVAPGETVLVAGAGGGVGSAAVQLAAGALEARVIAVDRAENAPWCRACGAAAVLDRSAPELDRAVADLAPSGVDVYWDCSGHHDIERTLPMLARGGRVVLSAGLSARTVLPVGACYTRDVSLRGFAISNASVADLAAAAEVINRELAGGRLRGRIRARLPLAEAARAHRMLEEGGQGGPPGRVVVLP